MLSIKNLHKSYSNNTIIDNLSFDIEEGQFITLLGKNGAGKSTLLRLLAGVEIPSLGNVYYKETCLMDMSFPYTAEISFIHENLNYQTRFTFDKFVKLLTSDIKEWNEDFFYEMLEHRKIDITKKYHEYSRGQKMQLALMLNLACNPKLILLDEITSVIDIDGRNYFLNLLKNHAHNGNTVIVTTNIVDELELYTDRLIILKDAHIHLNSNVETISQSFIKLREIPGYTHPIFSHEKCLWIGANSDGSTSYLIEKSIYDGFEVPKELRDKRSSTLKEVYLYYADKDLENA